jgi:phosphoribosylaminoimidazole carboxylase (NCAIR synthetase)
VFTTRLKAAVREDRHAPLVFLGNFEVENRWGRGEIGLPTVGFASSNLMVNRMDEFALLLAGAGDYVVVKAAPDPDYLDFLRGLGIELPTVLVVGTNHPERTVTEDAIADPALIATLSALREQGAALFPHGVSSDEERLSAACGLPLAAPSAVVCKAVNGKVYSRRLADKLGLRQPPGMACDSLAAWADAVEWARPVIAAGGTVGVKDAYGVSGKGISILRDEKRLDQLARMVASAVRRSGDDRLGLLVEEWVAKTTDLNYQFTVARDGSVHFDFVKEAVTEHNVHKGHRMPARLSDEQHAELVDTAQLLGEHLAADGYYGVVGIDAMIDPDGGLYPVIEINARNNMSTYQVRLQEELLGTGRTALARHYSVKLTEPLSFARLAELLGDLLVDRPGGTGLLVNNFATVNAALDPAVRREIGEPADGRLYGLLIGDSAQIVADIDTRITARLEGNLR